jgi:putative transposase
MREWRTASEFAAARLPGLPTSRFRVATYGSARGWKSREGKGRGGPRIEFHLDNLSLDQQEALSKFEAANSTLPAVVVGAGGVGPAATDAGATPAIAEAAAGTSKRASQSEIDAVVAAFEIAKPKARATGERRAAAMEFIRHHDLANGELRARDLTTRVYPRAAEMAAVGRSSIGDFWRKVQPFEVGLWPAVLTPKKPLRKSFMARHPEIADFAKGVVLERSGHISDTYLWAVTAAKFGLSEQRRETFERWARNFRKTNAPSILIGTNPDAARSRFMPAHGRMDEHVTDFLELVELDGSPSDGLTISTRSGRRRLLMKIDKLTRIPVVVLAPSESTAATGRLIIKFQRILGLPRTIRTDRGAGFISSAMRVFLTSIGIACLEVAPAYRGDRKPHIESFVRAVQRFLSLTPGYAGASVAQRQALRGRVPMSARRGRSDSEILGAVYSDEELEGLIDQWIYDVYCNRPHRGLRGRTPFQVLAEWQEGGGRARRIEDEACLFGLLAERERRVIGKKGVALDGDFFTLPEMADYPGQMVEARRLPDAGKVALFTTTDPQKFIGIAINDALLGQVDRQVRALQAAEIYKKHVSGVRKSMLRLVAAVGGNPAEILVGAASENGRVEVLTVPFSTPQLEEQARANEAAAAIEAPPRRANNLLQLPVKDREDRTSPEWRHAENERLSALPPESWSWAERIWMSAYQVAGDYLHPSMRSSA